jgi:superfamily II DNA/RNA helicase
VVRSNQKLKLKRIAKKWKIFKTMGVARHRVTVMFRATMPLEMERIAKRYLRHPSVISIGDKDSSKNALSLPQGIIIIT